MLPSTQNDCRRETTDFIMNSGFTIYLLTYPCYHDWNVS